MLAEGIGLLPDSVLWGPGLDLAYGTFQTVSLSFTALGVPAAIPHFGLFL